MTTDYYEWLPERTEERLYICLQDSIVQYNASHPDGPLEGATVAPSLAEALLLPKCIQEQAPLLSVSTAGEVELRRCRHRTLHQNAVLVA